MTLYNNKYRTESNHLKNHDYSSEGDYFVTICIKNRINLFGVVENRKIIKSKAGETAEACWKDLNKQFNNVLLGDYVFMPDHMHGIIKINKKSNKSLYDMVCAFKSKAAIAVNRLENKPGRKLWQDGFYDRIIRGDLEYFFVTEYILNNPLVYKEGMKEKEWYELFEERNKMKNP
jgi:REP element-mobilizing transposase RayT